MEFRLTPKYRSNQTFLQKAAAKGSGNANETAVFTRLWGPGRGHRGRSNGIGLEGKGSWVEGAASARSLELLPGLSG